MVRALVFDDRFNAFLEYVEWYTTITALNITEVVPCLREIEHLVNTRDLHAVGFISYEAAPAFDPALVTHEATLPLLSFGLFKGHRIHPEPIPTLHLLPAWRSSISADQYHQGIASIKNHIAAGNTYQVNFTFPLHASGITTPLHLFGALYGAQPQAHFSSYIETDTLALCSVSPELFFHLESTQLLCRPMKGTAPRSLVPDRDSEAARNLSLSVKDRAENLMIVDMIRNDMGRIARTGSVVASPLFTIERYETVWQMTSTVRALTDAPIADIIAALFPCASITGAPKPMTMRIIKELEPLPRGIYTGAIGVISPGRSARFSVAIRTAVVDKETGSARYGIGGGIVWDSDARSEYDEALTKAAVLSTQALPEFSLIETLLWESGKGFFLLDGHLKRLTESARYFGIHLNPSEIESALCEKSAELRDQPHKIRIILERSGRYSIEVLPIITSGQQTSALLLGLSPEPIDRNDRFLYHKTTIRGVYEKAQAACPECDDVILWNQNREVTETTIGNLVLRIGGRLVTPALRCGLLPGVFRQRLLQRGEISEAVIGIDEAWAAQEVFRINSVRRWEKALIRT